MHDDVLTLSRLYILDLVHAYVLERGLDMVLFYIFRNIKASTKLQILLHILRFTFIHYDMGTHFGLYYDFILLPSYSAS